MTAVGRGVRALALAVVVGLAAIACGSAGGTATPAVGSATASDSPSAVATDSGGPGDSSPDSIVPESPVAGIVVAVDSAGLDKVNGFTLRTNDGVTIVFRLGPLENATDFPPGHLKEHQTTAAPVLVFFRVDNGVLVVFRIEDAG